jgi:hypothetical protein
MWRRPAFTALLLRRGVASPAAWQDGEISEYAAALDLESALPGEAGHPRVGIDAEHPAPGRLELPGGNAAADV